MPKFFDKAELINKIFHARSVAIIGASSNPQKDGHMTLETVIRAGFEGQIYPVNPKGGEILEKKVYRSLNDIPGELDLAVIVIPARAVPGVLLEAAKKGVYGAIIQSAGFREAGRSDLEKEISTIAQKHNMLVMGPNIQGISYLSNKLCAMFYPVIREFGPLAVVSQSGTVTATLSEWAADEGLGISAAVNLGNQVDVCESDYIDYFVRDKNTKVIVMYLEGVKNGEHFIDSLKRAAFIKPLVILKGGRTEAGSSSAASHTGSIAGNHDVFSAVCRQFGAVVADDLVTLYDSAKTLGTIDRLKGSRLFVISSSGGSNTLAVDEAESMDLVITKLPKGLIDKIGQLKISTLYNIKNPLDLGSVEAEDFWNIAILADEFEIADIFLINFGDPIINGAEMILDLASEIKASLVVSYQGGGEEEKLGRIKMNRGGVPVFPSPERAIRGIASAVWRSYHCKAHYET